MSAQPVSSSLFIPPAPPAAGFTSAFEQVKVGHCLSTAHIFQPSAWKSGSEAWLRLHVSSVIARLAESSFRCATCPSVNLKFARRIQPGQVVTVCVEVAQVHRRLRASEMKVRLTQNNELVASGACTAFFA